MTHGRLFVALFAAVTVATACGGGGQPDPGPSAAEPENTGPKVVTPAKLAHLQLSPSRVVAPAGALNPTTAYDRESDALYLAWTRESGALDADGDPVLEAVVARSTDGGATFTDPVVVSAEPVYTREVSPTQVVVGPEGEVYVLYQHAEPSELSPDRGLRSLRLVRSDDGGASFSAPVVVGGPDTEGVVTSMDMATLFAAPDGDLHISFLDARENLEHKMKGLPEAGHSGHGESGAPGPENQLRVVRSADGGKTWAPSVLVARASCVCCGTMIAQGAAGPLYAGTRSEWKELKDSKDTVRDPYLSRSGDDGRTWGAPAKIHDDKFKVSGCPDVASGLAVDSRGRLHAAWYTGSESHPGVYYATSDDEGKTFSAPLALLRDEWIPYGDVRLALDGEDHAWVAFEDRRRDVDQVRVVRIDPDGRVAFSRTWQGTIPSVTAGQDWAAVTWQVVGGERDEGTSVEMLLARPGS